jgi:hypothetical protein
VKIGDLVRKVRRSLSRDAAGLGLVVDVAYKSGQVPPRAGYKVQWSNNYGTFWASEDKLEIISETR